MNFDQIVADLRTEKKKIEGAVARLLAIAEVSPPPARVERNGRPRRHRRAKLSPEARRKLSLAMKRRWASGEMTRFRR